MPTSTSPGISITILSFILLTSPAAVLAHAGHGNEIGRDVTDRYTVGI